MKLTPTDLAELACRAADAAAEAGEMIARSRPQQVDRKEGGATLASQVVTEIDRRSEDLILEALAPTLEHFELGLLTEERDDDGGRLTADHFWCIDPLDGTLPFVEGTPGYSVSIALVRRDGTPLIGVVYDPVTATLLQAVRGGGVRRNGQPWEPTAADAAPELALFADRSSLQRADHPETVTALDEIAHDRGLSGVRVEATRGGVLNACAVLAHPPACYFKRPAPTGGGSLWDFAATACIFAEAGAVATDIHGDPLDLNRDDSTAMNHRGVLYATDAALAGRLRAMIGGA
jgi:fructose-1,6-bisphosphatase/inositol monophosphatase family enzyme